MTIGHLESLKALFADMHPRDRAYVDHFIMKQIEKDKQAGRSGENIKEKNMEQVYRCSIQVSNDGGQTFEERMSGEIGTGEDGLAKKMCDIAIYAIRDSDDLVLKMPK